MARRDGVAKGAKAWTRIRWRGDTNARKHCKSEKRNALYVLSTSFGQAPPLVP